MTKDERFLLELYREIQAHGDVVNPQQIADKLGYKEKLLKNILRGLLQANLIKRYSPEEIALTDRGREVARTLLK